jgi:hypothetical protein
MINGVIDGNVDKDVAVLDIIRTIRSAKIESRSVAPIVERAKALIEVNLSDDVSMAEIADKINISVHYLCHVFFVNLCARGQTVDGDSDACGVRLAKHAKLYVVSESVHRLSSVRKAKISKKSG